MIRKCHDWTCYRIVLGNHGISIGLRIDGLMFSHVYDRLAGCLGVSEVLLSTLLVGPRMTSTKFPAVESIRWDVSPQNATKITPRHGHCVSICLILSSCMDVKRPRWLEARKVTAMILPKQNRDRNHADIPHCKRQHQGSCSSNAKNILLRTEFSAFATSPARMMVIPTEKHCAA